MKRSGYYYIAVRRNLVSIWLAGLNQVVQDVKWLLQSFVLLTWTAVFCTVVILSFKVCQKLRAYRAIIWHFILTTIWLDGVLFKTVRFYSIISDFIKTKVTDFFRIFEDEKWQFMADCCPLWHRVVLTLLMHHEVFLLSVAASFWTEVDFSSARVMDMSRSCLTEYSKSFFDLLA